MAELLGVPSLAFAVGIYLPLSTMTPVFAGGCIRAFVDYTKKKRDEKKKNETERGVLFASGLIAGEGLTGVGIAITALAMGQKPPGFGFAFTGATGALVSLLAFAIVGWFLYRVSINREEN